MGEYYPTDIVFGIFSYLPPQDILSCSLVCKDWQEVSVKYNFIRFSCFGYYPSSKYEIKDPTDTSAKNWISVSNKYIRAENNFWNKKYTEAKLPGHTSNVLCVSINHKGLAVSGGEDAKAILHR
jgi:hypothetical protein